ncbi:alpha/beta hydrolase [Micromonospora endolithica]|uniref:Alpha/beta hydrolase n=1 Tax=Micromonospora endolithica TaxID=230091 RepID=A0A3A9ZSW6_9ACTN|nr:alpha/beta hydrolase [Micromonospora endolithica]RKN51054.1 alpha/beta hydrolase [Micromonospora endolithica]TWJ20142.1 acetyl esterase [Micromonospora endolithica]
MTANGPLGARLVLRDGLDWEALTDEQVIAAREKTNRLRAARVARVFTGLPDRRARIEEHTLQLPGRRLTLRVHRPKSAGPRLPLILSFHGGSFVMGTAAQNDWINSHLAARCPAVVVSVEYRLAPEHPLPAPVDDGYDTLVRLLDDSGDWGLDPTAVAVLGESAGGTLAALLTLRAREDGPPVRAQVLTYPATDWSETMADYPSIAANAGNPGLSLSQLRAAARWSVPAGLDPRTVSPVRLDDLAGLPPALVVTGALDILDDQGARYVDRLRAGGTDVRLVRYPKALHGFVSMPGLVPAARLARREILAFLRGHLHPAASPARTEQR